MWSRLSKLPLLATILGLLLTYAFIDAHIVSAQDSPSWNKAVPKETPKPAARPRPRPASPVRRPVVQRPVVPTAPLLSVQYRIFKVNQNNSQVEVSPLTVFNKGDRLRIAVKANQDVFLYIIHQKGPNQGGTIFVPASHTYSEQNLVAKDQEFIVPSGCPASTPAHACSYEVDGSAGQESFTMIFSRNQIVDLSNNVLVQFINASNQKLDAQGRGDSIFSLRYSSPTPAANDKLIVRYVLNKRG